jgi:RecA/RadA recombinase
MSVKKAKQELARQVPKEEEPKDSDYLSTGVTLLNLATYGKTYGGLLKGNIYRYCGRSSSGKTFICRTILAEAAASKHFDGYDLIYDDVERGALMDTTKFFGQRLMDRLVPPAKSKSKAPIYSKTIGDFYRRINEKLKEGKRLIWIIDSLDSLVPDTDNNKMTDGKAKTNSQELRKLLQPLAATKSILVLVSQAHVDMKSMFGGDLAAGGRAPEFYSTTEVWLRKAKTLFTVHKGKKYPTGHIIRARVQKNRLSGLDRTVYFPFDPRYGIDDIGANIDFLVSSKYWNKESKQINAVEFDIIGSKLEVTQKIEKEGAEKELQVLTGKVWRSIEEACTVERKPRYV